MLVNVSACVAVQVMAAWLITVAVVYLLKTQMNQVVQIQALVQTIFPVFFAVTTPYVVVVEQVAS